MAIRTWSPGRCFFFSPKVLTGEHSLTLQHVPNGSARYSLVRALVCCLVRNVLVQLYVPTFLPRTHHLVDAADIFGDISLGLYLVRGDALVLMGELDETREETPRLRRVSADEIIEAQQEASAEERQDAKLDWLFQDLS